MKKNLMRLCFLFLLVSCQSEDLAFNTNNENDNHSVNSGITVEDGYLKFQSEKILENFISEIENSNNSLLKLKNSSIGSFKSISSLKNEATQLAMKSTLSDNDEEMSIDEYNVMRAENLLLDPILTEVMDTTLRIGVADRIYKITEYGTFSVPSNKVQLLDDAVKNFNKNLLTDSDLGDYVDLGDVSRPKIG